MSSITKTLSHSDALHLIDDLRRLDPALRTLIEARMACEICMNPKHEYHGQAHGDQHQPSCQYWPFESADKCDHALNVAQPREIVRFGQSYTWLNGSGSINSSGSS